MELAVFRTDSQGKVVVYYMGTIVCRQNNIAQASKAFYKFMKSQS